MSDIQGRVLSVVGRQTQRGGMMYKVAFSDGNEYVTFEQPLAHQANSMTNQDVEIRVNVQQKGQYTNRYLNAIALPGQLPPEDLQSQAGQSIPGGDGIPVEQPRPRGGGGQRGMSEADKVRISRMGSLGTAFDFIGKLYTGAPEALDEAKKAAFALARELYNEARSHEMGQATVQPDVQDTPQTVAAAVPGVEVGAQNVTAPDNKGANAPVPEW